MKKNALKILSLAMVAMMMVSCGGNKGKYDGSSKGEDTSSDSSAEKFDGTIDEYIELFLDGTNLTAPSVDSYELDWDVYYSYSGQYYMVEGEAEANHETEVLADLDGTDWIAFNDDYWYPVEEYGYLYVNDEDDPNVVLNFYDFTGGFFFNVSRYDGTGLADVTDVDTSWYVDYLHYYYYEKTEIFPEAQMQEALGVEMTIADLEADLYVYGFNETYIDDYGYFHPNTFSIVVEGNKVDEYVTALTAQGFGMSPVEEEELDWDTWEYVTVLTGYEGFDNEHNLYVFVGLDEESNTKLDFSPFEEVFTDKLTENTDWTDEEKALMTTYLGGVIPFFQMGDGYVIGNYEEDDYDYAHLYIVDNYYQDRTAQIAQFLKDQGFKEDSSTYDITVYTYDNKTTFFEVWMGYQGGTSINIYYEPSKFVAATAITIEEGDEVEAVAGASIQLNATLTPEVCDSTYEFSVEGELATVTKDGLVTISNDAPAGSDITVTATTSEGLTDTITIHVVADVLTGITLNAESVRLSPGKTFDIEITPSPIGASLSATPTYEWIPANAATGVSVSDTGRISVAEGTEIGVQGRVVVHVGELTAQLNVLIVDSVVTDHLTTSSFGMTDNSTSYVGYDLAATGAHYVAVAANGNGRNAIQLRTRNNDSGIVGAGYDGRTIKSVTLSFHADTGGSGKERSVEIYASNTAFEIEDMYSGEMEPLDKIVFDSSELTKTFTFTEKYAYVGLRSANDAVYLNSIDFVWEA